MNLENIASKKLFDIFFKYRNRPFIFVQRSGNFGDFLIWKGAEKLAKIAGINPQTVDFKKFLNSNYPKDSVIYIHGGGGSNGLWTNNGVIDVLLKAIKVHSGVVILGPETFCVEKEFFREKLGTSLSGRKAQEVYIFVRDKVSYDFLKIFIPKDINLELDHDTALNLCASDLGVSSGSKYTLYAIRQDKEAINIADKDFFSVWLDPIAHCRSLEDWLQVHADAKKVITNRLHSAVVGAILGKPVTLLPNSYHKNRAVWEYSLQARGVQWSDELKLCAALRAVNRIPLLRRVFNSYKLQRALQVFYGV